MTKESSKSFWQKVADIQEENPTIDKKWHNKHLNYHYALIDDVLRTYKPLLTKHGLVLYNMLNAETGVLTTVLQNTDGDECLSTTYNINMNTTDQKVGASLTYWRRYNAWILLNIATDEDIDWLQDAPKKSPPKQTYNQQKPVAKKVEEKVTFTAEQQNNNFAKHYEAIQNCKNMDELKVAYWNFLKDWKAVWYFTKERADEIIELKESMKMWFAEKVEVKETAVVDDPKVEASVNIDDEILENGDKPTQKIVAKAKTVAKK